MVSARIGRVGMALVWIAACTADVTPATPTPGQATDPPTASPAASASGTPEPISGRTRSNGLGATVLVAFYQPQVAVENRPPGSGNW